MGEIAYKSVIFVNISVKYITSLSFDLCHNKIKSHFVHFASKLSESLVLLKHCVIFMFQTSIYYFDHC
jgi:histidinol phosphatase-like enzyme